jgi:hypothetical protein
MDSPMLRRISELLDNETLDEDILGLAGDCCLRPSDFDASAPWIIGDPDCIRVIVLEKPTRSEFVTCIDAPQLAVVVERRFGVLAATVARYTFSVNKRMRREIAGRPPGPVSSGPLADDLRPTEDCPRLTNEPLSILRH